MNSGQRKKLIANAAHHPTVTSVQNDSLIPRLLTFSSEKVTRPTSQYRNVITA